MWVFAFGWSNLPPPPFLKGQCLNCTVCLRLDGQICSINVTGKAPRRSYGVPEEHNYISGDADPESREHLQCYLDTEGLRITPPPSDMASASGGEYGVAWLLALVVISLEDGKLQGISKINFYYRYR